MFLPLTSPSVLSYNTAPARGYPDISSNGANFVVAANGALYSVFGTSAAAPTVGAIFSLINKQRIKAKKGPVGFVNPVFYANPQVLNDIVGGGNAGCETNGFVAVTGASFSFLSLCFCFFLALGGRREVNGLC